MTCSACERHGKLSQKMVFPVSLLVCHWSLEPLEIRVNITHSMLRKNIPDPVSKTAMSRIQQHHMHSSAATSKSEEDEKSSSHEGDNHSKRSDGELLIDKQSTEKG